MQPSRGTPPTPDKPRLSPPGPHSKTHPPRVTPQPSPQHSPQGEPHGNRAGGFNPGLRSTQPTAPHQPRGEDEGVGAACRLRGGGAGGQHWGPSEGLEPAPALHGAQCPPAPAQARAPKETLAKRFAHRSPRAGADACNSRRTRGLICTSDLAQDHLQLVTRPTGASWCRQQQQDGAFTTWARAPPHQPESRGHPVLWLPPGQPAA